MQNQRKRYETKTGVETPVGIFRYEKVKKKIRSSPIKIKLFYAIRSGNYKQIRAAG